MAMEAYGHPCDGHSAMALTVGLPVAMTAKMIMDGTPPPWMHAAALLCTAGVCCLQGL